MLNFGEMDLGILKTDISTKIYVPKNFTITILPYRIEGKKQGWVLI